MHHLIKTLTLAGVLAVATPALIAGTPAFAASRDGGNHTAIGDGAGTTLVQTALKARVGVHVEQLKRVIDRGRVQPTHRRSPATSPLAGQVDAGAAAA